MAALKYFLTLLWIITTFVVGLLIFTSGFLLKRIEIKEYNSCDMGRKYDSLNHIQTSKSYNVKEECWMLTRFRKSVIIIIDALRYDFIKFNTSLPVQSELPFQNKLKSVHDMLTHYPDRTALYKFIADPPTTTMQRLKGLTTGSLPTFVDAGANFAGSEIEEDNIIDQLKHQQKRIVFMGDDTWLDLYPSQFAVTYPFPSLNVKDLDTVDNGVIANIFHEMDKSDWDIIIGHFLGVDHCGHTYGPYHSMMAEKLNQMDNILRKVISSLPDDALLVVFGDHGMTRTGDHGGDSKDELEAGLFFYSKQQILPASTVFAKNEGEPVAQIDLVATLSLLLGLPIPFSNLGRVIPELFAICPQCTDVTDALYNTARASHLNSNQVRKYLQSYSKMSDEFPHQELLKLEEIFHSADEQFQAITIDWKRRKHSDEHDISEKLRNVIMLYQTFLHNARLMCDQIWAQFDVFSMCVGALYFILCLAGCLFLDEPSQFNKLIMFGIVVNILALPCLAVLIVTNVNINGFILYSCAGLTTFPVVFCILFKLMSNESDNSKSKKWLYYKLTGIVSVIPFLIYAVYLCGYLSNSYVVYDDSVTSFMLQSIVWIMFYNLNQSIARKEFIKNTMKNHGITKKSTGRKFDVGRVMTSPRTLLLFLCLALCSCLRLAGHFRPCREEQWTCETTQFMQPLSAIADSFRLYKNIRYFVSVVSLATVVLGIQKWLKYCGNLNGYAPSVLVAKYLIPFNGICIGFYWAFQALPKTVLEKFETWQQDIFAQLGYINFLAGFLVILIYPLSIFNLPQNQEEQEVPFLSSKDSELVPKMYNHLKLNWQTLLKSKGEGKTPVVYGLATVYSSVIVMLVGCLSLLLALLLGDGIVGGLVLQVAVMFLFLELHACTVRTQLSPPDYRFYVPWCSVICWCLICSHFYYATGHQATIPAIRFEAAYVGFHGDFNVYILPAILILLNTFASHALGILALPLLLFWPCVRGKLIYYFEKDGGDGMTQDNQRGELVLHEDQEQYNRALFHLCISYLLIGALKAFTAMLSAGIHRRHLMVWKIFAPRFIFEAAILLFTSLMLLLVYLITQRINRAVSSFIKKLS